MDAYRDKMFSLFTPNERVYCQKVIIFEKIDELCRSARRTKEALEEFAQAYLRATGFDQQFLSECGIAELEEES